MTTSPTVEGSVDGCTITIAPVSNRHVNITVSADGREDITRTVTKNRWANRSASIRLAEGFAQDIDRDKDMVLAALNDALAEAMVRWNWRSFMIPGTEFASTPSYEYLKSLTDASEYSDLPDFPDTDELRDMLEENIFSALRNGRYVVLESPTGSGKTYIVATTPWLDHHDVTGGKQVIQFSPTKESRDQAVAESEEAGVSYSVILNREEACDVAAGDHDDELTVDGEPASEWLSRMCDLRGFPFSEAKALLVEMNDQNRDELPCSEGDEKCDYQAQWDTIRDSLKDEPEFDVIHATHGFVFVPRLRHETNIVFDELPSFAEIGPGDSYSDETNDGLCLTHQRVFDAVTAYLKDAEAPVTTASELVSVAKRRAREMDDADDEEIAAIENALLHRPNREWYLHNDDAHIAARVFTRVLWSAAQEDPDANGLRHARSMFQPPSLSTRPSIEELPTRQLVSMVLNEADKITTLRIVPEMNEARTVVGTDAHPIQQLWQLNIGDAMSVDTLLSGKERRLWRRYERRLCVIRMGQGTYSYTSAKRFNAEKVNVVVSSLREHFGSHVGTAIAPKSVEDDVEAMLAASGVDSPETMHQGDVESRNDFDGETIGIVIGCIDPGDDYVKDILAELGMDARPERSDDACNSCGGKGCPNCDETGKQREFGRKFVGPNADDAAEVLASVRENQVAQSIGRYARRADDPNDWAAVFVRTDAAPDNMIDFRGPAVWSYTDKQRAVTEYLHDNGKVTSKEITEWINDECEYVDSCTKRNVMHTLQKHLEYGNVTVDERAGLHGADLFEWSAEPGTANGVLNFHMEQARHRDEVDISPAPNSDPEPVAQGE